MKVRSAKMYKDYVSGDITVYGQLDNGKYFMGNPDEQIYNSYDSNPDELIKMDIIDYSEKGGKWLDNHFIERIDDNIVVDFEKQIVKKLSPFKSKHTNWLNDIYFYDPDVGWNWDNIYSVVKKSKEKTKSEPFKQPKVNNSRLQKMSRGI